MWTFINFSGFQKECQGIYLKYMNFQRFTFTCNSSDLSSWHYFVILNLSCKILFTKYTKRFIIKLLFSIVWKFEVPFLFDVLQFQNAMCILSESVQNCRWEVISFHIMIYTMSFCSWNMLLMTSKWIVYMNGKLKSNAEERLCTESAYTCVS